MDGARSRRAENMIPTAVPRIHEDDDNNNSLIVRFAKTRDHHAIGKLKDYSTTTTDVFLSRDDR